MKCLIFRSIRLAVSLYQGGATNFKICRNKFAKLIPDLHSACMVCADLKGIMISMSDSKSSNKKAQRPFTNSRQIRRENDRQFLKMVLFSLVVVGGFIIALVYGVSSLLTAVPILLGGAAIIALPYLTLKGIEWLVKRYNGEA